MLNKIANLCLPLIFVIVVSCQTYGPNFYQQKYTTLKRHSIVYDGGSEKRKTDFESAEYSLNEKNEIITENSDDIISASNVTDPNAIINALNVDQKSYLPERIDSSGSTKNYVYDSLTCDTIKMKSGAILKCTILNIDDDEITFSNCPEDEKKYVVNKNDIASYTKNSSNDPVVPKEKNEPNPDSKMGEHAFFGSLFCMAVMVATLWVTFTFSGLVAGYFFIIAFIVGYALLIYSYVKLKKGKHTDEQSKYKIIRGLALAGIIGGGIFAAPLLFLGAIMVLGFFG